MLSFVALPDSSSLVSLFSCFQACGRCHSGGDLVCCDGCDAVYHPECVGITVVPEGDWFCPACVSAKAKKTETQRTTRGSALVSGAVPSRAGAKSAVAGANDDAQANTAGNSKRARPTAAVETAATAAAAASSKKPRTAVSDKGGGAASGSKPEQAASRAGGGRQSRQLSHTRMERVPIQLGSARGAASSLAGVSQNVSSEANARAPAGSAATKNSTSSASNRSEKDGRTSVQLGKRPQAPQPAEQHHGKRLARVAREAAAPTKIAAKPAAPQQPLARSAVGGSITPVGRGAQRTTIPVRSEVPKDNRPGGEWDCLCCSHHNRPEDKRCRRCEALRLIGAEVARKVPRTIAPAPSTTPAAVADVAVPVAALAPPVDSKSLVGKPLGAPKPPPHVDIEPVFSRPASAVANAAAAAALAAAAAGARAAVSPRSQIEPIFSRPASAVANAAAAAAAAAAGAASARASRAAQAEPAPSRVWCCRACSTINRRTTNYCVSCRTRREIKQVEAGKPDWWCCRKCSRFNNRGQDGNTCRVCSAVDVEDEAEQEEDEEMISVGEEISMPAIAAAPAERFVQL